MPNSVMPPYRFLFETRTLRPGEAPAADALPLPNEPSDEEVVPTDDGRALAAYLISLHSDDVLFETPPPPAPKKSAAAGSTNTPATSSNAPAASTNAPTK